MDLEQRLASLEHRAAIGELVTRYGILLDDHDFDAVGALFAPDAGFGSAGRMHRGRAAIVANYRDRALLYPVSRHVVHGLVLHRLDTDEAAATVTAYSEQAGEGGTVATAFRYEDVYTRSDEGWLFAERVVSSLYALAHADLAAGLLADPLRVRWPHRAPAPADLPPACG